MSCFEYFYHILNRVYSTGCFISIKLLLLLVPSWTLAIAPVAAAAAHVGATLRADRVDNLNVSLRQDKCWAIGAVEAA